jgi:hypothetical protein
MEDIKQEDLLKGEFMEEQLRIYFLELGYYVIRGAKFKFAGVEVTDVDLWLYQRSTPIARERINVDIKNKTKPMAIERIIVAKGIRDILDCDRCIVATTDIRDEVIKFGDKHKVTVLNGKFLQRIKTLKSDRYSEEIFSTILRDEFSRFTTNWFVRHDASKSRLLENLDFVTSNAVLQDIQELLTQIYSTPDKRESLLRLLYVFLSHLFIAVDFLLKDMAFIEMSAKMKNLEDGFRFGITGESNIRIRVEQLAKEIKRTPADVRRASEDFPADILRDFFGKNEIAKNLFKWAKDLEDIAYKKLIVTPSHLPLELKSIVGIMCDIFRIDRKLIMGL